MCAALVHLHSSVRAATERLGKRSASRHFLSPRDFLDLLRKFTGLVAEKKAELEEQQRHLNVGLARLAETQASVAELQAALATTDVRLREKNQAANSKLSLMLDKQQEAEKEKATQQLLSVELEKQNAKIAQRTNQVREELAEAEPDLLAAQEAVSGIKKSQLDEVRALPTPPKLVQLTLEAVCAMLGSNATNWGDIRKIIKGDTFIKARPFFSY